MRGFWASATVTPTSSVPYDGLISTRLLCRKRHGLETFTYQVGKGSVDHAGPESEEFTSITSGDIGLEGTDLG